MDSSNPENWINEAVPSVLRWWWFFEIVSSCLGIISYRMEVAEIEQFIAANVISQIYHGTAILSYFLIIAIINRVQGMQISHVKSESV